MIWTIIGILILGLFWAFVSNGKKEAQMKERQKTIEARKYQKELREDPDLAKKQWEKRVKDLNIDLERAVRVKYYVNYYKDKNNTYDYSYEYLWDEDGAIAQFGDYKGANMKFAKSPLEWTIYYHELVKIKGVYKRNDATLLQYMDGSSIGFAPEEAEKIKEVYKRAKQREE